jgi:hypothetical protein
MPFFVHPISTGLIYSFWKISSGALAELMTDYDRAGNCYEQALRHNPYSVQALSQIASLCRGREQFSKVKKKRSPFISYDLLPCLLLKPTQLAGC